MTGFARMLTRINARLSLLALLAAGLGLITMTAIVAWTVFGRYVLNATPTWGEPASYKPSWGDLGLREWAALAPLGILVFYIGLAPALCIKTIEPSITRVLSAMEAKNTAMGLTKDMPMAERFNLAAPLAVAEAADAVSKEHP